MLTKLLAGAAIAAPLALSLPAWSAPLVADGVSYTLESEATANPLTEEFALVITGYNTASDTEGGRSGINAIALTNPPNGTVSGGAMLAPPTGWTFKFGGINSSGCDGSGNFFCFDNTAIPPTPATALTPGTLTFVFTVTLSSGNWSQYGDIVADDPHFKIDWVGSKNNYDLVSLAIDVSPTCPDCTPTQHQDVPEPASLVLLGVGLLGVGFVATRKRRI